MHAEVARANANVEATRRKLNKRTDAWCLNDEHYGFISQPQTKFSCILIINALHTEEGGAVNLPSCILSGK